MIFLIYLIPLSFPLLILLASKHWFGKKLTSVEIGFGTLLITVIAVVLYVSVIDATLEDEQLWNGEIVSKAKNEVSCIHTYACNCRTSDGSKSCSTCYRHDYDWSWALNTTAGELVIRRIDSQGVKTPPIWDSATTGEPVSLFKPFKNYLQASPLYFYSDQKYQTNNRFQAIVPEYPRGLDHEYSFKHAYANGLEVDELPDLNRQLADMLKVLGPEKQVNVMVLIVNTAEPAYIYALEKSWLGGKPNDVIVVVGSTDFPRIEWVDVVSWSSADNFKQSLRDDLSDMTEFDVTGIVGVIRDRVRTSFVPLDMENFKYLVWQTEPSLQFIILILILVIAVPVVFANIANITNMKPFMAGTVVVLVITILVNIHYILVIIAIAAMVPKMTDMLNYLWDVEKK